MDIFLCKALEHASVLIFCFFTFSFVGLVTSDSTFSMPGPILSFYVSGAILTE